MIDDNKIDLKGAKSTLNWKLNSTIQIDVRTDLNSVSDH